jgi:hypothetical protein
MCLSIADTKFNPRRATYSCACRGVDFFIRAASRRLPTITAMSLLPFGSLPTYKARQFVPAQLTWAIGQDRTVV